MADLAKRQAWTYDQLSKSLFFRERLSQWGLLDVAESIENIPGETLDWELDHLGITGSAWNRIVHAGIKPIVVFANPAVLVTVHRSVSYYRMLAMASQKSMIQLGLSTVRYEQTGKNPDADIACKISIHLNFLISSLIESDERVNRREFDIWRGMAAGSQAQGSWQNRKGDLAEREFRRDLFRHLEQAGLIAGTQYLNLFANSLEIELNDGRILKMGREPDLVIFSDGRIQSAVEIKGGIDSAGVLERVGAAIKSLRRAKEESPGAITILIMSGVSMSPQARTDIESSKFSVNYWFTLEDILGNTPEKTDFYRLLNLS